MNKCDGIKILELDPKRILEGNEYMVIAEKDQNFKAPINQIVDLVVSDDRLKNYIDTTIESSIGDFKNEVNQSISELTSKINNLDSKITTYSFGSPNGISEFDSNEVVYQTKTSYNGITITSGNDNDSDTLCLGANAYNITLERCQEFSNVAIYYFALYNKSLTPEEIETEKERLNEEWLKRKTE